jgi:hypothetical protein
MPNATVKDNLRNVRAMKKNCKESEVIRFVEEVQVAVSKSLSVDIIKKGLFN